MKIKFNLTKEWLVEELKMKKPKQIASEVGCSVYTIYNKKKNFGLVKDRNIYKLQNTMNNTTN